MIQHSLLAALLLALASLAPAADPAWFPTGGWVVENGALRTAPPKP
jgi:hypothetical protein